MNDERAGHVRIDAPAKVNLGLEILSRRGDGYHELHTILAMIELADTLDVRLTTATETVVSVDMTGVDADDNLISKAAAAFCDAHELRAHIQVSVQKRIPMAAGLGGASSDAAAMLVALQELSGHPMTGQQLEAIASRLGSDVPFFLGTPCALASGRGTELLPLTTPTGAMLLVVPRIEIPRKTATLYGSLTASDFSDGEAVLMQATRMDRGERVGLDLLRNAFTRPLYDLFPDLENIPGIMRRAGCLHIALSGAGPTHFALFDDPEAADVAAGRIRECIGESAWAITTAFRHVSLSSTPVFDALSR